MAVRPAKGRPALRIWIDALVVTVLAATFARTWLAQGLRIDSGSMENALYDGDHVLVNRFIFAGYGAPAWIRPLLPVRPARRGEVVVLRLSSEPGALLVKRIAALPGDRVAFGAEPGVPVEGVFVLGDRRERSYDSRAFGAVPERDLVGKPLFVYWSRAPDGSGAAGRVPAPRGFWGPTRWERTFELVR